jgi:PhzF family phenazine biosynthesis protein
MIEIFQVDAFTDVPFRGNPAAVCLLDGEATQAWMQDFAAEMNLSETAFLRRERQHYHLRWFTPVCEVDLCGHATLAAAHILWERGLLRGREEARFETRSGLLLASRAEGWIEMDFPSAPAEACEVPEKLMEALQVRPAWVGKNRVDFLVQVESEREVREAAPNFALLKEVSCRGVILTGPVEDGEYDFVSRFFAPAFGVDEDPVTGSAHCCLAPFWGGRLKKSRMTAYQVSRRGGKVGVRVAGDRVILLGQAVTIMRCSLTDDLERSAGMEDKKSYQEKMEAQFQHWGSRIDEVLERVEKDAKVGYDRLSGEVRKRQKVVEQKLTELTASSSEAWQEAKPGLEKAWKELREVYEKLASKF